MSISKTIQFSYVTGQASNLTINVLSLDGSTVIASGLSVTETAAGSMTYNSILTAVVTQGTYRINLLRSSTPIGQFLCDLNEIVGNYPCFDGPTPYQLSTTSQPIQNNVYVQITPSVSQAAQIPNTITCLRGDTLLVTLTIGTITGWQKLIFTAKVSATDTDSAAMIQITALVAGGGGLIVLNGAAAANIADGSMTVTDSTAGTVALAIAAEATATFPPQSWYWDCEVIYLNKVITPASGKFNNSMDITQLIS